MLLSITLSSATQATKYHEIAASSRKTRRTYLNLAGKEVTRDFSWLLLYMKFSRNSNNEKLIKK